MVQLDVDMTEEDGGYKEMASSKLDKFDSGLERWSVRGSWRVVGSILLWVNFIWLDSNTVAEVELSELLPSDDDSEPVQ